MRFDTGAPLGLFFDHDNKVLLVAFSGIFDRDTTLALNKAAKAVVERHGHVAVILDFTDVSQLALQLRDWPELGNDRRAIRGKPRVLVAPQTGTFAPLRLHGTFQASGGTGTQVVATRTQAERALGLTSPKFEPIDLP
jgi:hypothetical protein